MNPTRSVVSPDCFVTLGKMALPNQYFAGRVGSKFLVSLRDNQKVLGVKCPQCGKVFIPPREYCVKDMTRIADNWVELSTEGVVTNYTVVHYSDAHLPRRAPYVLAMVQLEGADTPLVHILEEVEPEQVQIGMKVKAVFAGETRNTIREIDHFAPV